MDFIEQIFGWSPDGGSGALEFALIVVPAAGVAILAWRKRIRVAIRHILRVLVASPESRRSDILPDIAGSGD